MKQTSLTDKNELKSSGLKSLLNSVKEKYQIDLTEYALPSLKRRIERFIEVYKLDNLDFLKDKLLSDSEFIQIFVNEVTVNTTELFRDPWIWIKIKNEILPQLSENKVIRIWHAACSTGEEVYSMAILLDQLGLLERTRIYATDLNEGVILKGKKGEYPLRNLEVFERNYSEVMNSDGSLSDYFQSDNISITFHERLTKHTTFKKFDLVLDKKFLIFDLILCRNVLIYFNPKLQSKVLQLFVESLFSNGWLIVGAKETIAWSDSIDHFDTVYPQERIYKKIK